MLDRLMANYWYKEGENAWFVSTWSKDVYRYNFEENKIEFISQIPDKKRGYNLYVTLIKHKDDIYCFPDRADCIWKYSITENKWERNAENKFNKHRASICLIEIKDNIAYLFSKGYLTILEFDLNIGKIIKEKKVIDKENESLGQTCLYDNKLYVVSNNNCIIYCIDYFDGKSFEYKLPINEKGLNTITEKKGNFYLTGFMGQIYKWQPNTDKLERYIVPKNFGEYNEKNEVEIKDKYKNPIFIKSFTCSDKIYFLPYLTNKVLVMDNDEVCLEEIESVEYLNDEYGTNYTDLICENGDDVILCSAKDKDFVKLNAISNKCSLLRPTYTKSSYKRMMCENINYESKSCNIDVFVKTLSKA